VSVNDDSTGNRFPRWLLGLGVVIALVAGWGLLRWIGGSGQQQRAWGEVSYAGKPIEQGEIVFTPVGNTAGPATGGAIVNGAYEVAAARGPVVGGTYRVAINGYARAGRKIESAPGVFVEALDNIVPSDYNVNTTLQVTISARASENRFDFRLEAR
jgi:hypothetical protein